MTTPRPSLAELARMFLRLGAIGFGGGMAVVALLERELVGRRKLMPLEEFLHGVALAQILGPIAVNASIFVGSRFFGVLGGLACAGAFLAPSVTLVILLSWVYFSYHTIPALQSALIGLGPVVLALILSAAWSMGRKAARAWPAVVLMLLSITLVALKVNSLIVLAVGATAGLVFGKSRLTGAPSDAPARAAASRDDTPPSRSAIGVAGITSVAQTTTLVVVAPTISAVAWAFLKAGLVFFGGGFVLIPVLHETLVESLHWLTAREFLDGLAISNLTPGPIAVIATFTGYHVGGVTGALVATFALFLPAMTLMSVLSHFYRRLKDLQHAQNLLAGLGPVVVGMIGGAAIGLAPSALPGVAAMVLGALALVLLVRFAWHPAFVLAIGAVAGMTGLVR